MIKRITCFSRIKPADDGKPYSEQVFSIFNSARVFNKEHHIVGAFVVQGEILLQVLEGDANDIAKALYRVNRDPRIEDVSIILNKSFETSAFTHWSIKVIKGQSDAHKDFLTRLKQLIAPHATFQSAQDHAHFKTLFASTSLADNNPLTLDNPTTEPLNFRDHTLGMSTWPRPTRLRLNAPLMKLCQILIGHTVPYQRLLSFELFNSEAELNEHLKALYQANALEVFDLGSKTNINPMPTAKKSTPDNTPPDEKPTPAREGLFSQALKQFIQGHDIKRFNSQ